MRLSEKLGYFAAALGMAGCCVYYSDAMSARDIIRQIEALPPEEQREVKDYFARKETEAAPVIRRMDAGKAAQVSERVFSEHSELFRKLAQ